MKTNYLLLLVSLFSVMSLSAAPTKGLQFTGAAASYLDGGQKNVFAPEQFTIEVWASYESTQGAYILCNEGWDAVNGAQGFALRTSGSKIELSIGANGSWPSVKSNSDIALNTWMHIAVTYSGTEMKVYVNGVEDGSAAVTAPMVVSAHNLSIGEGSMWKDRRFTGKMGDMRFWNVVRSQAEIAASMTTSLTGAEEGLIANWKMNEGAGNTVADATGNHSITKTDDVQWFSVDTSVENTTFTELKTRISENHLFVENNYHAPVTVTVFTVSGQKVMENDVLQGASSETQLNGLSSGVYILKCTAVGGKDMVRKFIL